MTAEPVGIGTVDAGGLVKSCASAGDTYVLEPCHARNGGARAGTEG